MNLLKNYSMSLSDVYREGEVIEDFTPQSLAAKEESWARKFIKTFLIATLGFAMLAVIYILLFDPFKKPVELSQPSTPPPPPPELVPAPPGYVQIQVIEFADGVPQIPREGTREPSTGPETPSESSTVPVIVPGSVPVIIPVPVTEGEIEILPLITGSPAPEPVPEPPVENPVPVVPVTRPEPPQRPMPAPAPRPAPPPAPMVSPGGNPMYAIAVQGATPAEYDILNELARDYSTRAQILTTHTETRPKWQVYVPYSGTGVYIENTEVMLIRTFPSRGEAIIYAQNQDSDAIIRAEDDALYTYDVRICCMELDDAKIYARRSGITDKLFQLKRE